MNQHEAARSCGVTVAILSATAYAEPSAGEKSLLVASAPAGAVTGQLIFGVAADFIGRRVMFITTAAFVICGSLSSAIVGQGYKTNSSSFSIFYQLAVCRFLLGFGIGGEYPLSATVASETTEQQNNSNAVTNKRKDCLSYLSHKPNSVAAVFSMQGVGMLLSPLLVMFCIAIGLSLEATWRLCLGTGAFPSAVAFVFRWKMHETAAFKKLQQQQYCDVESSETAMTGLQVPNRSISSSSGDSSQESFCGNSKDDFGTDAISPPLRPSATTNEISSCRAAEKQQLPSSKVASNSNVTIPVQPLIARAECVAYIKIILGASSRSWGVLKRYRWVLFGTSITWFLIDVALYGTGSFKSAVVGTWFFHSPTEAPSVSVFPETHIGTATQFSIDARKLSSSERNQKYRNDDFLRSVHFENSRMHTQRNFVRLFLKHVMGDSSQKSYEDRGLARRLLGSRFLTETAESATRDIIMLEAQMGAIVALLAIPGYFLSLFLIHRTGVKPLQFWGFLAVATVFISLGIEQLLDGQNCMIEVILFGLTFLCSNFGPNTTTFILPTQLYPTIVRATCHGFSAAMGKLGGVVGTSLFSILLRGVGLGWLLVVCGCVAMLGAACTLLIPNDAAAKEQVDRAEIELTRAETRQCQTHYLSKNVSFD